MLRLVMVMEGEPPPETMVTLRSLQEQTDTNWKLWTALPASQLPAFASLLRASGSHPDGPNVEMFAVPGPVVASQVLDIALSETTEADVALIFPGDVWAPDAVSTMAGQLTPTSLVYADEDRMDAEGSHSAPRLKPAYSPEFLLHAPYTGRPMAVGSSVARHMATLGPLDPVMFEHDFALRASECAQRTVHISEVLCHTTCDPGQDAPHTDHVVRRTDTPEPIGARRTWVLPGHLRAPSNRSTRHLGQHHHSLSRRAPVPPHLHRNDRRHEEGAARRISVGRQWLGPAGNGHIDRAPRRSNGHQAHLGRSPLQLGSIEQFRSGVGGGRRPSLHEQRHRGSRSGLARCAVRAG